MIDILLTYNKTLYNSCKIKIGLLLSFLLFFSRKQRKRQVMPNKKLELQVFPFFVNTTFFWSGEKKKLCIILKEKSNVAFDDDNEGEEKTLNNEKEAFSNSGCYDKDWVLSTNEQQKLNTLICCLCNQIANKAVELQCDEHENIETTYVIGEECLQRYLKQSNGKCPIGQHDHCEFSKSKIARQQVSDLLVICPRQYDLQKRQSKEGTNTGEKGWHGNETSQCNYKGKIREIEDHLNNSCQLISTQHIISLVKELQSQLKTEKLQTVLSSFFFFGK
ncbi:hypothetical protein RFI_22021 [Reticulomyxa filosa]|uniref:TRAF-type domain-containing protein n=1 Tax=Reticulomyxa filosa TaxID=46433 RepID=X6MMX1_RETFI|nr:hypothetical protein RFI_22021 [Reticulomyxa filosa]|eukprot:ETO15343.1 hypothetical protein RFI_22021 [Reticulomyxa filosa]